RYSNIVCAANAKIFCDEPYVYKKIFSGYSKIRRSRAEGLLIHDSQFIIRLRVEQVVATETVEGE
ncbi:hypothetical protein, partial [Hallella bergensis]|uniref:hypothetical protein n=1 Tax=Hallella bergensis TaxID=242750 RepID=UPI0023F49EF0